MPHRVTGEVPVVIVVKAKGRDISEDELKLFFFANAPAYAHPRHIDFVTELPALERPERVKVCSGRSILITQFFCLPGPATSARGALAPSSLRRLRPRFRPSSRRRDQRCPPDLPN